MNWYWFILILLFSFMLSEPELVSYREMKKKNTSDGISLNIKQFIGNLNKNKGQAKLDRLYTFDIIYGEMLQSLNDNNGEYFTHANDIYYVGEYAISNSQPNDGFYNSQRVIVYSLFNSVYGIEAYDPENPHYLVKDNEFRISNTAKASKGFRWYSIKNDLLPGYGKLNLNGAGISKKKINYTLLAGTAISGSLTAYYSYRYSNSVQPHVRYAYEGRRNLLLWSDLFFVAVYGWYLFNYHDDEIW